MNIPPKGFVGILLLVVIAILLVGGGVYVFLQKSSSQENMTNQPQVVIPTTQVASTASPVISFISPSDGILTWGYDSGTPITITGSNFNFDCKNSECDKEPHVFVKITDSNGRTAIVGNAGPDSTIYPKMVFSVNAEGTMISLPAIPNDIGPGISPGKYFLSVLVDGKGTSNTYPITVVSPSR